MEDTKSFIQPNSGTQSFVSVNKENFNNLNLNLAFSSLESFKKNECKAFEATARPSNILQLNNPSPYRMKQSESSMYTSKSSRSPLPHSKGTSISYTPNRRPLLKTEADTHEFYTEMLRELESLKFTTSLSLEKKSIGKQIFEIDCDKFFSASESKAFDYIVSTLGESSYELLRRLFHAYSSDRKSVKILSARDFLSFCKEFRLIELIPSAELHLLFAKQVPMKFGEFKDFVDLMFRVAKRLAKKAMPNNSIHTINFGLQENSNIQNGVKPNKDTQIFNWFLEEFVTPHFITMTYRSSDFVLDSVVAFRPGSDESPLLEFFVRNDEFFKKVKFLIII